MPDVCPYELISFSIVAHNHNVLSGSETWGSVDVSKAELTIKQVATIRPGDALSVTLVLSNALDEHLHQTKTIGKSIQA